MKKTIYILMALLIVFGLIGCSKEMTDEEILARAQEIIEENATATPEPQETSTQTAESEESSAPSPEASPTAVPSDLTFEEVIEAYTSAGIEVDIEEKPLYEMIGAIDGVIFYIDRYPVKIYVYESSELLTESGFEFDAVNGRFGLESSLEKAQEIWASIED